MATRRGRVTAVTAAVLGAAVAVGAVVVFREPLLEQWYLWRLQSTDAEVRDSAAERLGHSGSLRAVPGISSAWALTQTEEHRADLPRSRVFVSRHERQSGQLGSGYLPGPHSVRYVEFSSTPILAALGKILEREEKRCVPVLVDQLRSPKWSISCLSLAFLGELGQQARPALPALHTAATEPSHPDVVRELAICVVAQLETEDVVPTLLAALKDRNPFLQNVALNHLWPYGSIAIPGLMEALEVKHSTFYAVNALGNLGVLAHVAIPRLIELLAVDEDENVRHIAAYSLGRIGVSSANVLSALEKASEDSSEKVRTTATESLGRLGRK